MNAMWLTPARRLVWFLSLASSCIQGQQFPQGGADYRKTVEGMHALEVSITLDRQEYLQGEQIVATVVVSNPTSEPITALPPFRSPYTSLNLSTLNKQGEWEAVGGELGVNGDSNTLPPPKLITITPGGRVTQKVSLMEIGDAESESIRHDPIAILAPGPYRIRFSYERPAQANFQVVKVDGPGTVQAQALKDAEQYWNKKSGVAKGCFGMWAAALRSAGKTILVASVSGMVDVCRNRTPDVSTLLTLLSPFTRIAEPPLGVSSIVLEPIADGAINVRWTDIKGTTQHEPIPRRQFRDVSKKR